MDKILLGSMYAPSSSFQDRSEPGFLDLAATNTADHTHMNLPALRRQIDIPALRSEKSGIPSFSSITSRQQIGKRDMSLTFDDDAVNEAAGLISNPLLDRLDEKQKRDTKIMLHTFFEKGANMYRAFISRGMPQNVQWFKHDSALCQALSAHVQNRDTGASSAYVISLLDLHRIIEKEGRLKDKEMIERLFFNLIYLFEQKEVQRP